MHLFRCAFKAVGQKAYVFRHSCGQFLLGDAADGGEFGLHGDVGQVVDGGKDAELREFGDARDEAEAYHGLICFKLHKELLHCVPENIKNLRLMKFV